jgi:hypothetical protein
MQELDKVKAKEQECRKDQAQPSKVPLNEWQNRWAHPAYQFGYQKKAAGPSEDRREDEDRQSDVENPRGDGKYLERDRREARSEKGLECVLVIESFYQQEVVGCQAQKPQPPKGEFLNTQPGKLADGVAGQSTGHRAECGKSGVQPRSGRPGNRHGDQKHIWRYREETGFSESQAEQGGAGVTVR